MAIKLLIVEDNDLIQRMYDRAFSIAGFEVTTAGDGTIVSETIKLNRPDIIVMDVMMPNFNGLDTLHELKTNAITEKIPVIMLSAYSEKSIVDKAMAYGASRYLVKNEVEPNDVIKVIREVLIEHGHPAESVQPPQNPQPPEQ